MLYPVNFKDVKKASLSPDGIGEENEEFNIKIDQY